MRAGNLLTQDPPDHTRLRRMLTREFTQARIKRLQPRVSEIVDDHLTAMEKAGPARPTWCPTSRCPSRRW